MQVKQIMTNYFGSLQTSDSLLTAAELYLRNHVVCAPVLDRDGKVVAVLTLYQLVKNLISGLDPSTPVSVVMETDIEHLWIDEQTLFCDIQNLPLERLLVRNTDQQLTGILTRIELIKAVHDALQEKSNELSTILECLHNGIIAVNLDGIVKIFNPAAERITGIPANKALGKHLTVAFPYRQDTLLDVLGTGNQENSTQCYFNQTKAICNRTPIIEDGKIVGAVSVLQDVSELEHVLNELKTVKGLNSELRSIIESSRDGIIVADDKGIIIRVNNSLRRIIGAATDQPLVGISLLDLTPITAVTGRGDLQLWEVFQKVASSRDSFTTSLRCPAGLELLITASPVFDESQESIIRIVFDIRDLTELMTLQAQLESTKNEQTRVNSEVEMLRKQLLSFEKYVYQSPEMLRVLELSIKVAQVDSTVLILGESGVGKEIIAKIIHKSSKRKDGPFIQVNCGAIPENLLESELFGYEKGAFTGANREGKLGMFEIANNGTLLLDEIGELPLALQVKLLRAIQERQVYRIGGVKPVRPNVRIIAATNKNLQEMVKQKLFREDLFYRLNVVPIVIPPLRERKSDILPLAVQFLQNCNKKYGMSKRISPDVYNLLEEYQWPGNIRELENLIERIVIMSDEQLILPRHLPYYFGHTDPAIKLKLVLTDIVTLKEASEMLERELVVRALSKYGSTRKAAKALGVTHATVLRKAHQYNIGNNA